MSRRYQEEPSGNTTVGRLGGGGNRGQTHKSLDGAVYAFSCIHKHEGGLDYLPPSPPLQSYNTVCGLRSIMYLVIVANLSPCVVPAWSTMAFRPFPFS